MSHDVNYQQTEQLLQASSEPTTVAYPRLIGYGYFVAVFIAMSGWLWFLGWVLWQFIDWAFA